MEKKEFWTAKRRKILCGALLVCVLLLGMTAAAAGTYLFRVLSAAPELDLSDLSPDGYRTVVLDDTGAEMTAFIGEEANREYVTIKEMPRHLQQTFVAIEDERFYDHRGIDLRGILRAAWQNVTSGSLKQGASTITQQLIKNNLYDVGAGEQTVRDKVERKLQEQYLALQLEKVTDKDWILENYLNTINLGGGTWGVQTAAWRYFGKEVGELTLSESAVLAAIPKSPTYYNPAKNPEANADRRELVLGKLLELEWITKSEYDTALVDDVYGRISEHTAFAETEVLSYFEDMLVYEVLEDLMTELGYTEEKAWNLLYRGGLTVESTQNTALQTICEEEINNSEWYDSDAQASLVVTDPQSGAVKAIVGGRGEKTGSLVLNRATTSLRQPGSTIKVVGEYAAALEGGIATLATVYDDAPYTYSNGTSIRNAGRHFDGMTSVRSAIVKSTNVVALKCFQQVGMEQVWEMLQSFGFAHLTEEDKVEALALGGTHGGVTNLEMTAAYNAIAAGGIYTEPYCYTRVLDRQGNVLLENAITRRRVLSAETSALLTLACENVIDGGSGQQAYFGGMAQAGKSGTTTEMRDVWFVGYTPYYTCGVWGGYDDYGPQENSAYVKKLWKAVMQRAHEGMADTDFTYDCQLTEAEVCAKCGELAAPGVCEDTVQGDMSRVEYFAPGTEPRYACTCHVQREYCRASGKRASFYCPDHLCETKVYLRYGTDGTMDAAAVLPEEMEVCDLHTSIWDKYFSVREPAEDVPETAEPLPEESPEEHPWWHYENWWPWL